MTNFIQKQIFNCYCDGATSNNYKGKGIGGFGWVILDRNDVIIKQNFCSLKNTTNNECELTAMINVCEEVKNMMDDVADVFIHSDSAYIINCYKQNWYVNWQNNGWKNTRKQPVANKELWEKLIPFFEDPRFRFIKVNGHQDNKWNNYVDEMAVKAKFDN